MEDKLYNAVTSASDLRRSYYGEGEVIEYSWNILSMVNESVQLAVDNNKTSAIIQIPTQFEIGQMAPATAQKHVYFKVASVLINQGYAPKFRYEGKKSNKQKVFLKVTWLNKKDEEYDAHITETLNNLVF